MTILVFSSVFNKSLFRICAIVQRRFITPWLKPEPFFKISPLGMRQEKCVKVIHRYVDKVESAVFVLLNN